jgi:putative flippase GtrA
MNIDDLGVPEGLDRALGRALDRLPRPMRFVAVGCTGLLTDLTVFSLLLASGLHPLLARLISITLATFVTWRLNRAFTFEPSDRHQGEEAMRYAVVTIIAQATSYAIFATLTISISARLPQAALVISAAIVALISYNGHRWFAFARRARPHNLTTGRGPNAGR